MSEHEVPDLTVPELEHGCGSWVITDRETGEVIFETFVIETARKVNQQKFRVETTLSHLVRLALGELHPERRSK